MQCNNCGAELEENSKFCGSCGFKINLSDNLCPECGAALEAGAKFCGECGCSIDTINDVSAFSEYDTEIQDDLTIYDRNEEFIQSENVCRCTSCGAELEEDDKFCEVCGQPTQTDDVAFSDNSNMSFEYDELEGYDISDETNEPFDETADLYAFSDDESEVHVCPNCGAELSENAKFCEICGYSLQKDTAEKKAVNLSRINGKKSLVQYVIISLSLLLVCGLCIFVFKFNDIKSKFEDDSVKNSNSTNAQKEKKQSESSDTVVPWNDDNDAASEVSSNIASSENVYLDNNGYSSIADNSSDENIPYNLQIIYVNTDGKTPILSLDIWENGDWIEKINTKAYIGQNGITYDKTEGDKCTPAGTFDIGFVFGLSEPDTNLDFKKITKNIIWVDDKDSDYYNTWQNSSSKNKDWKSGEKLYSKFSNKKTNYCITFNFNGDGLTKNSAQSGKGSTIFIEGVTSDNALKSGYGDIKISGSAMLELLSLLDKDKHPIIKIN